MGHSKPIGATRLRSHEHVSHLTFTGDVTLDCLAVGAPFRDKSNIARWEHAQNKRRRGDTWFIPYDTAQARAQKFDHPGTFPLDLPRWCIRLHSKPGATVLDPFAGAGTISLAALAEGAHGIGTEIDPAYVAIPQARLDAAASPA